MNCELCIKEDPGEGVLCAPMPLHAPILQSFSHFRSTISQPPTYHDTPQDEYIQAEPTNYLETNPTMPTAHHLLRQESIAQ